MTRSKGNLTIRGTTRYDEHGLLLVLDQRLNGHDTFLSGQLDLGDGPTPVRIISLDDVTVLRPMRPLPALTTPWTGTLHLPHGIRPRSIPADLAESATARRRDLGVLDPAEMRYALTFLGESTTELIRTARIEAIVSALPMIQWRGRVMESVRSLVSLDIGGTLGNSQRPGLAALLATSSPLGAKQARRIMRDVLHTAPRITEAVVDRVCSALQIEPSAFPRDLPAAPLVLFPGTVEALQELSREATIVTLSNVTCTEADPERLLKLLSPWVRGHFPSCRIGYAKPDYRAFWTVADSCGVPLSTIIHVGDDWECDIRGATSAGMRAVWISHGRTVPEERSLVEREVLVADDFADAVQHVRHLLTRRLS